jgi:hypothetical protein
MIVSVAILCVFLPAMRSGAADSAPVDQALDVTPIPTVDENLFFVSALADLYNAAAPADPLDAPSMLRYCAENRLRAWRLTAVARQRTLDLGVMGMCDDYLGFLDAFETGLSNLGKIDRQAKERARADAWAALGNGLGAAIGAEWKAKAEGKDADQARAAGNLEGLKTGAKEYLDRADTREQATDAATQAEKARVRATVSSIMSRTRLSIKEMAARYHWAADEARLAPGFDESVRPRDPFLRFALAKKAYDLSAPTPAQLMQCSRRCLNAARLVPAGAAYDGYRIEFMELAAQSAADAADQDVLHDYKKAPSAHAAEAVRIGRTLMAVNPHDASGLGRRALGRALAAAGRFNDSLLIDNELMTEQSKWKDDPSFEFHYARVAAATNHPKDAANWLRSAYSDGFCDVKAVLACADLDIVQQTNPAAYEELTDGKMDVSIKFGVIDDDVILTNRSRFALTGITLKVEIRKGNQTWKAEKKLDRLSSGKAVTFDSVFSIPNNRYDDLDWNLECNQGEFYHSDLEDAVNGERTPSRRVMHIVPLKDK